MIVDYGLKTSGRNNEIFKLKINNQQRILTCDPDCFSIPDSRARCLGLEPLARQLCHSGKPAQSARSSQLLRTSGPNAL
jgi:hypothetical protein